MAVSVNPATGVITIPRSDLTALGGSRYSMDIEWLRLQLKKWEDSENGVAFTDTHRRNAPVTLSGVIYAQTFEIIAPYTVTFEDGAYTVYVNGGNHNLADVKNVNQVSLVIGNSAGMIVVETGVSGLTPSESADLALAADGGNAPTATEIADAVLNRDMAAVADTNSRTLLNAIRFLRNKWLISGTTLSVKKENDVTEAWQSEVTAAPGASPISGNDPA